MSHVAGLNTNEIYLTSDDEALNSYKIMAERKPLTWCPVLSKSNLDRTGSIYMAYKDAIASGKQMAIGCW